MVGKKKIENRIRDLEYISRVTYSKIIIDSPAVRGQFCSSVLSKHSSRPLHFSEFGIHLVPSHWNSSVAQTEKKIRNNKAIYFQWFFLFIYIYLSILYRRETRYLIHILSQTFIIAYYIRLPWDSRPIFYFISCQYASNIRNCQLHYTTFRWIYNWHSTETVGLLFIIVISESNFSTQFTPNIILMDY